MDAPEIGSKRWLDAIRLADPVDIGKGRPTERFHPTSDFLGRRLDIDGLYRVSALLLLEILTTCGLVTWFKERPFKLTAIRDGISAKPQFTFRWRDTTQFVLDVESGRFFTRKKAEKAEALQKQFAERNLSYLVWTDTEHVTSVVRRNVEDVRSCGHCMVDARQVQDLREAMRSGPTSVGALADRGIGRQAIFNQAHAGRVHFNLLEKLNVQSAK